jgi:tungstate transport system ATP-binding protein
MVMSLLPAMCTDVTVQHKGKKILGPLSWELTELGCSAILGPNGAGKTTLLRLLHGLQRPRGGSVQWQVKGADLYQAQSFVFQSPIVMRRSVVENVLYPLLIRKIPRKMALQQAMVWLEKVGLSDFAAMDAKALSGGERQKMALARALVSEPEILFLDEATTNLDGAATAAIEAILKSVIASGCKIVMTTHDLGQARRLADEIVFLHKGLLVENTTTTKFFEKPETALARSFVKGDILL